MGRTPLNLPITNVQRKSSLKLLGVKEGILRMNMFSWPRGLHNLTGMLFGRSHGMPDKFLITPFTRDEVVKAVCELHKNKAAGADCLTSEHLQYTGDVLVDV